MKQEKDKLKTELIIQHVGKDGKLKPIFQENKFFRFLMDHNLLSPKFPKIPLLLGRWSYMKRVEGQIENNFI